MDIILLDIPEVKGNSGYASHKDKIIIYSFSFGITFPLSTMPGNQDRTKGQPSFSEISLSKTVDQSTTQLYAACAGGKPLGAVKLYIGRNEGDKFMEYMNYEMTDAMVSQISTSGSGDSVDSFSLNFVGIKSTYTQQNANSTKKGKADFGWNLVENAPA